MFVLSLGCVNDTCYTHVLQYTGSSQLKRNFFCFVLQKGISMSMFSLSLSHVDSMYASIVVTRLRNKQNIHIGLAKWRLGVDV